MAALARSLYTLAVTNAENKLTLSEGGSTSSGFMAQHLNRLFGLRLLNQAGRKEANWPPPPPPPPPPLTSDPPYASTLPTSRPLSRQKERGVNIEVERILKVDKEQDETLGGDAHRATSS